MLFSRYKTKLPTRERALAGRPTPTALLGKHAVLGTAAGGPFPVGLETAIFGMGCFWGAERIFWRMPGVFTTATGYSGGYTPNPTYRETCTGLTAHTEAVRVIYDPTQISYAQLLKAFWEGHDPTQGMRQGADVGTQYRSAIYTTTDAQSTAALASRDAYQQTLTAAGWGPITTEILPAGEFYPAESEHQQYLYKVPNGYCGHGGTGVSCPLGVAEAP